MTQTASFLVAGWCILCIILLLLNCSVLSVCLQPLAFCIFNPGVHPVPDRCGMVRRTRRIRAAKVARTNSRASGVPVAILTIAADAHRLVANPARKPRRPRQEVTHLQRKRPLPRPSRVGLSRKEPAHRHLPSFTIVRVSLWSRDGSSWSSPTT